MVRLLAAGFVLAAMSAAWLYWGGSQHERSSSPASDQGASGHDSSQPGPAAVRQASPRGAQLAAPFPAPLRMTAKNPVAGAVQPATVRPEATSMSLAEAYASEAPNAAAATERTEMIRDVVDDLVRKDVGDAKIRALECRARHCLLRISGDDSKGVTALVDALQDERGFLGKAESLMMSRDQESIHIYLRFAE